MAFSPKRTSMSRGAASLPLFLNLGELHAGYTDVDDLGEKGYKRAEPEPGEHPGRPSDLSLSCSLSSLPSPVGD